STLGLQWAGTQLSPSYVNSMLLYYYHRCPFCSMKGFTAEFRGPKTVQEREKEEAEERQVRDLEARIRAEEIEQDMKREEEKKRQTSSSASGRVAPPVMTPTPPPRLELEEEETSLEAEDFEELMIKEAIRLSLLTASAQGQLPTLM